MELFYNPERMSETDITETFVANQWLVDEIISIVKGQPKDAAVQHVVIVAPRGMGKTTLLLMLRLTALNHDIARRWQPVLFPEESYSVYDLADLWVEVLDHLATETGQAELHDEVERLKSEHPDSAELEPMAFARIKDWRVKHKKRLLMLVDSLDLILDQIGDERDNAGLRQVLMNDGTMMFVGASTTFFKEARAYDQPLYNFFKIYDLNGLNSEQIEDLLRRRAKLDGVENFEEILRTNRTRLRVLEYFTGGNPRLVLMLYRVITQSQITEVRRGLEKLLDEVTPYYKAKIETLPPQQRKILDQIARISAQTREGLTPTEIAAATRLPVNQVSSQLKRLADGGYVRAANIRSRSSYYTLSEPLYAIWHQMRFGRDARKRMEWLVTFLKGWYDAKELDEECERLEDLFTKYMSAGLKREARDALEHRRYLMEANEDQQFRIRMLESIIVGYLELREFEKLKSDMLAGIDVGALSGATQQRLRSAGVIISEPVSSNLKALSALKEKLRTLEESISIELHESKYIEASEILQEFANEFPVDSPYYQINRAVAALFLDKSEECLGDLESVLEKLPDLAGAWTLKGIALKRAGRFEEAAEALKHAIEIFPDSENFKNFELLGDIFEQLGRYEEALANFEKALRINPPSFVLLYGRARVLAALSRTEEARSEFDRALSLEFDSAQEWYERGVLLGGYGQIDEALKSFERAADMNPNSYRFVFDKCWALKILGRNDEALECVEQLLKLEPESADAYFLRGVLNSKDLKASLDDLKHAYALTSSSYRGLVDDLPGRVLKVKICDATEKPEKVKQVWDELIQYAKAKGDQAEWLNEVAEALRFIANAGHWTLAQELIVSANLEQPLFPMSRALEYLIKGDEAIIEKLSPEMRSIVDEIVMTFKKASGDKPAPTKKSSSRKKKSK